MTLTQTLTKTCNKCKETKSTDEFFNMKRNMDGKDSYCKSCRYTYSKKYNQVNRDRIQALNRERRREKRKDKKRLFGEYSRVGHTQINESLPQSKDIPTKYMLDELKKESGYIYLIKDHSFTGHIKVGKSVRPDERIQRISGQMPIEVELELLDTFYTDDMHRKERILHMFFADKRQRGEWFSLNETDINLIHDYMNQKIKLGWYA